MRKATWKRKAEALLRRANPDAPDMVMTWDREPRIVTFPTGYVGWVGTAMISARGYRTKLTVVTSDAAGSDMVVS